MVLPIFIIPLLGTFLTGMAIYYIIGDPIAGLMKWLSAWLATIYRGPLLSFSAACWAV